MWLSFTFFAMLEFISAPCISTEIFIKLLNDGFMNQPNILCYKTNEPYLRNVYLKK